MDNMIDTEDLAFTKGRIVKKRFWRERKAGNKPGIQSASAEEDAPVFTLCESSPIHSEWVNNALHSISHGFSEKRISSLQLDRTLESENHLLVFGSLGNWIRSSSLGVGALNGW